MESYGNVHYSVTPANAIIIQVAPNNVLHIIQCWDSLSLAPTSIGGRVGGCYGRGGWEDSPFQQDDLTSLSAAQEEDFSFMKFTHSHIGQALSAEDAEEAAVPMRQLSGEITPGC